MRSRRRRTSHTVPRRRHDRLRFHRSLDDIRSRGFTARATCWFVRGWIDRHSRYADLLTTDPEEGTTAP